MSAQTRFYNQAIAVGSYLSFSATLSGSEYSERVSNLDTTLGTVRVASDISIRLSDGTEQAPIYTNVGPVIISLFDTLQYSYTATWTPPANIVIPAGARLVITEKATVNDANFQIIGKWATEAFVSGTTITTAQWSFRRYIMGGEYEDRYLYVYYGTNNTRVEGITFAASDTQAPSITLTPESRATATTNISVAIALSDNVGVTKAAHCFTNSATPPALAATPSNDPPAPWIINSSPGTGYNVSQSIDGVWYLHVWARDAAGNHTVKTSTGTYTKDATVPSITLSAEGRASATTNISVTLTLSDAVSGVKRSRHCFTVSNTRPLDGDAAWSAWDTSQLSGYMVTETRDGVWYLHVQCEDNTGNVANKTSSQTYTKDTAVPSQPTLDAGSRSNLSENIVVTVGNIADNIGVTKVGTCFTNSATPPAVSESAPWVMNNSPGSGFTITQTADGTWYAHAYSKDAAGNVSAVATVGSLEKLSVMSLTVGGEGELITIGQYIQMFSGESGLLRGLVTFSDAVTPVVGAKIYAIHISTDALMTGFTGADGRYDFGPVPVGEYHMIASLQDGLNYFKEKDALRWIQVVGAV